MRPLVPAIIITIGWGMMAMRASSTPRVGVVNDDLCGTRARHTVGAADSRSGLRDQHTAAVGPIHVLASSSSAQTVVHRNGWASIEDVKAWPGHAE